MESPPLEDGEGQFYRALENLKFSPTSGGEGLGKWVVLNFPQFWGGGKQQSLLAHSRLNQKFFISVLSTENNDVV